MADAPGMPNTSGSENEPFSLARMRGSLYIFGLGKVLSGLIGVAWLLTLVRALDITHYGGYVVLLALLEIVLLVSNAGVYPFAQRYITEARLPRNLQLLPRLLWSSLAYRMFTLLLAAGALMWFAEPLANTIGQPSLARVLGLYAFVIVFEGAARYLELTFEALLEQGRAQLCALSRNTARLLAVTVFWSTHESLGLADVIHIEAVTSGLGLLLAVGVMAKTLGAYGRSAQPQTRTPDSFSLARLMPFALPLFLAQCLTQLYSPDAIKLLVSRILGVVEAATFGFAHAICFVLQRYLPANLLIGLIRPMLVARRANSSSNQSMIVVGNLILKINLFLLLPLAALFAVAGREFSDLVSGGKYPQAAPLLFMLTLLMVLNGLHVVLSMLATALEDRRAVLVGTLVSVPGIGVGLFLVPMFGATAMVLGLWLSEILWCAFTVWMLRQRGFHFYIDMAAWTKLLAAACMAAAVAAGLAHWLTLTGNSKLLMVAFAIGTVYLVACLMLAPVSTDERKMLLRLMPKRWQN
jgi:O-antigen/teichoic acid export membrane protein